MGEMLASPEDKERNSQQTFSHLCWDCFEKLEAGEFGEPLREIYYLYHKLQERNWGSDKLELIKLIVRLKNGISVEELSQEELDFHSKALWHVVNDLSEVYDNLLKELRTPARIELDQLKEEHRKTLTTGESIAEIWRGGWRPEGFVGDGPGEERPEVLFGIDLAKGNLDITAPTIVMNDGTGQACELNKDSNK